MQGKYASGGGGSQKNFWQGVDKSGDIVLQRPGGSLDATPSRPSFLISYAVIPCFLFTPPQSICENPRHLWRNHSHDLRREHREEID
jgi:hypothetical protein